jgi:hypothetical protein
LNPNIDPCPDVSLFTFLPIEILNFLAKARRKENESYFFFILLRAGMAKRLERRTEKNPFHVKGEYFISLKHVDRKIYCLETNTRKS